MIIAPPNSHIIVNNNDNLEVLSIYISHRHKTLIPSNSIYYIQNNHFIVAAIDTIKILIYAEILSSQKTVYHKIMNFPSSFTPSSILLSNGYIVLFGSDNINKNRTNIFLVYCIYNHSFFKIPFIYKDNHESILLTSSCILEIDENTIALHYITKNENIVIYYNASTLPQLFYICTIKYNLTEAQKDINYAKTIIKPIGHNKFWQFDYLEDSISIASIIELSPDFEFRSGIDIFRCSDKDSCWKDVVIVPSSVMQKSIIFANYGQGLEIHQYNEVLIYNKGISELKLSTQVIIDDYGIDIIGLNIVTVLNDVTAYRLIITKLNSDNKLSFQSVSFKELNARRTDILSKFIPKSSGGIGRNSKIDDNFYNEGRNKKYDHEELGICPYCLESECLCSDPF
jgi:hypothetical protein